MAAVIAGSQRSEYSGSSTNFVATIPPMPTNSVPVEHRVLGLDKRKMAGTLGVFALIVLCATDMQFIDSSIR